MAYAVEAIENAEAVQPHGLGYNLGTLIDHLIANLHNNGRLSQTTTVAQTGIRTCSN